MSFLFAYIVIGIILALGFRVENDKFALLVWPQGPFIVLFWPVVLAYFIQKIKLLRKGERVLWRRKK